MGVSRLLRPTRPPKPTDPSTYTTWLCLATVLSLLCHPCQVFGQVAQNVTFQNTASELSYSPPVCNVGTVDEVIPDNCIGTWTIVDLAGSSNGSVTSTEGPADAFNDLLPQVFFTFQGSALFVKTSDTSNATGNFIISSQPSGNVQSVEFSPTLDFWAVRDLDESQTTTVVLTFVPDPNGTVTRLDIDFIKIAVANASATSSFLSTPAPASTTFTPTFAFPSTVSPTSTSPVSGRLRQPVGTIVGETLAAFFGLLLLGLLLLFAWQWQKQRRRDEERRQRSMQAQAASQILAGGRTGTTRSRHTGSGRRLPSPITFEPHSPTPEQEASVGVQPRVVPFPTDSLGRSSRRSDPLPRARERVSSAFTVFTGGASSALAEDGHSGIGAAHSRGASASF